MDLALAPCMTNEELENRLRNLVTSERKITQEILVLIREADRRLLFRERGYPNIYEWLVQEYGYSHAAAHRRIQSARLVEAVPKAMEKLEMGVLNLTVLSQVQSAIHREEKRTGEKFTQEEKEDLLSKVEGKPAEAAQKIMAEEFPDSTRPKETFRARTADESTLTITLKEEAVQDLRRAKEVLSNALPSGNYAEVISRVLKERLKRSDPLKSAADKRRVRVLKRANGQCEFVSESTGRRCTAREHLELDHIKPLSLGGTDDEENLRVLCREHNLYEAERILGADVMRAYRNP